MAPDSTQRRIVDAAIDYMNAFGSEKLNLGDVARLAGVGRATVHRHFGTREGLVEAVRVHLKEEFAQTVVESVAPCEKLHEKVAMVATLIRRSQLDRGSPVWTGYFSPLEKASLVVDHAGRNIVELCDIVRPFVVEAQANGEIRADLDVEFTCEWLARICMTFVFDPANLDIDDDQTVVEFFRANLSGLG